MDIGEVTEEQAQEIVNAVQNAEEEVREAFEDEINIFNGKTDTYVPVGSSISVGERRVVIAAAGAIMSAPAVAAGASSQSSGNSSDSRKRSK